MATGKKPTKIPEECFAEAGLTDFKRTLEIWVSMQVISFCPSARIHSQNCDVAMAAHCTRGILTIYVSSTNLKTCPYRICVWVFCLFCFRFFNFCILCLCAQFCSELIPKRSTSSWHLHVLCQCLWEAEGLSLCFQASGLS